jgi:hypothetical protein
MAEEELATDLREAAVAAWLRSAIEDAERRGLPELRPLLEGLAKATMTLRAADWNDNRTYPGRMVSRRLQY